MQLSRCGLQLTHGSSLLPCRQPDCMALGAVHSPKSTGTAPHCVSIQTIPKSCSAGGRGPAAALLQVLKKRGKEGGGGGSDKKLS